ncbi:MAG: restriction endonuclease subunit S [Anaerolinea sp.]|nr:restriction endonuclease subunit S [Anaerolinea sp.]
MIPPRTLASIIAEHGGTIQTGPFGSQLHQSDYASEGIPFVMPKDIVDGRVNEATVARVPEEKARQLSRHFLKAGDIVFPRRGDISKCALIGVEQEGFLCGSGCLKIQIPTEVYVPRFLYYYLGLRHTVEWLERNAVGTTMLNLSEKIVGGLPLPIIALGLQSRIVGILSAYDDLIENNRRRIRLLEEAARLLYREWFVHLRFPGHEHVAVVDGVPEGWERKTLGEVAPLNYGKGLRQNDRIPGPFAVYGSSGIVGTHVKALVSGPTIIVGRKGNVGSVYWSPDDCYPIDTVYFIETSQCSFYLYYVLQNLAFISTDVAVPGLNRDYAHSRVMLVPDMMHFRLFESTVAPLHGQIKVLRKQNATLASARDLLLPRLMNGEISV